MKDNTKFGLIIFSSYVILTSIVLAMVGIFIFPTLTSPSYSLEGYEEECVSTKMKNIEIIVPEQINFSCVHDRMEHMISLFTIEYLPVWVKFQLPDGRVLQRTRYHMYIYPEDHGPREKVNESIFEDWDGHTLINILGEEEVYSYAMCVGCLTPPYFQIVPREICTKKQLVKKVYEMI